MTPPERTIILHKLHVIYMHQKYLSRQKVGEITRYKSYMWIHQQVHVRPYMHQNMSHPKFQNKKICHIQKIRHGSIRSRAKKI